MRNNQQKIPGLEELEIAATRVQEKRDSLEEQVKALKARILKLELEVSLLRIRIEKGKEET